MRGFGSIFVLASSACGGIVEAQRDFVEPASTLVLDERSCLEPDATVTAERATTLRDPRDALAVAEVLLLEECTGLGGSWVIGREVAGSRTFAIGGHGCRLWTSPPVGAFAVVRYRDTDEVFSTPPGACVAFPGEDVVSTRQATSGLVLFEDRESAETYAAARR